MSTERELLPKNVKPITYNLEITPSFEDFTFTGQLSIQVEILEPTDCVVLNVLDITFNEVSLVTANETTLEATVQATIEQTEKEQIEFHFEQVLETGEATLVISYNGELNDKLCGFYRSTYVGDDGEEKIIATTQMEPADARRALPCWDEPAIKAKFNLTLNVPKHMVALGNMPVISKNDDGDLSKYVFDETPIMSTYLLAFVVGEFEFLEDVTSEGITVRVWTTPGKIHMGKFALEVCKNVLSYFASYFGIPYPLPKQDMIAIPDFSAGAMENWGLITYRQTALLCDDSSSVSSKKRVAYVVAHELAHQWFGNLVTMEWWKELWLNEGFATFVGNLAVDNFFPQWDIWTSFVSDYIFRALDADSLVNSHPIEVTVNKARSIEEIFDVISYCKGASVIRMIENYLGEEAFKQGLNIYLNKHAYSNAVTEDLWEGLTEGSGVNVTQMMDTWVKEIGYPVVSFEEVEGEKGKIRLRQDRFLSGGLAEGDDNLTVWPISIGYVSDSSETVTYINFNEKEAVLEFEYINWIKFNAGQSGFYRVKYSDSLRRKLGVALEEGILASTDRLGLVNDTFALAKAGLIELGDALEIIGYYKNEADYNVWADIAKCLSDVKVLFSEEEFYGDLKKFIKDVFTPIGEKLGYESIEGESDLDKLLRPVVLNQLGNNGDDGVVQWSKEKFANYLETSELDSDLISIVFSLVMKNGGEKEYIQMKNIYENADDPDLKIKSLAAIPKSSEKALVMDALDYSMGTDKVRTQDLMYPFHSAAHGPAKNETWDYVKNNWESLTGKITGGLGLLGRIIQYTTSSFTTNQQADEIQEFFEKHKNPSLERTINQSIESIRSNAAYVERSRNSIAAFLNK
eukprot:TRINITY_DN3310_c1_g1_i1.p1 TRINITY_DN3310_c1_g1~~TRINITY_DN3310_c1_g1_i1.p1  ORF type:complete len:870 (+),score=221.39 TRINITY_DN3310_c1_g1_i1:38-2611(+)